MGWIIGAAILNTLWTLWCVQFLPPRVATKFGLTGQACQWMSRKGFARFSILLPIAISALMLSVGKGEAIGSEMERMAAGMILFFSFLTWSIVRSNKRTPPQIDYMSLLISIGVLVLFVSLSVGGISKALNRPSAPSRNSQK
ncbi:MAG: hypothetical protein P4L46_12665 [Fimbriimonas sp.]|nr:hypothetical protein [Fimbriimonas sp.]